MALAPAPSLPPLTEAGSAVAAQAKRTAFLTAHSASGVAKLKEAQELADKEHTALKAASKAYLHSLTTTDGAKQGQLYNGYVVAAVRYKVICDALDGVLERHDAEKAQEERRAKEEVAAEERERQRLEATSRQRDAFMLAAMVASGRPH